MFNLDPFINSSTESKVILPLIDSQIEYYPNFFSDAIAQQYFQALYLSTEWRQDVIKIFGKTHAQPRLTALYGNSGKTYTYSGITMYPNPFDQLHLEILRAIKVVCDVSFTSVLLNLYRDGNDSNGWHSDNEKELGVNPVIASVSFGATRFFQWKHRKDSKMSYKLSLKSGSLLIMKGATQHHWLHQLPKSKNIQDPRINLTFRQLS
jgi:alkylated DNA repair dioxygenase AlkB